MTDQPRRFRLLLDYQFRKKHPMWARWIPWAIAEQAWEEYKRRGHGDQSLERVHERGGLCPIEIDALLAGKYTIRGLRALREEEEDFERASGKMICERCGLEYWRHPMSPYYISYDGSPVLNRLCDGKLVKL